MITPAVTVNIDVYLNDVSGSFCDDSRFGASHGLRSGCGNHVPAAPEAIAYNSGQFTTAEFVKYGIPSSILLLVITWFAVTVI